jgi:hypothetical protein
MLGTILVSFTAQKTLISLKAQLRMISAMTFSQRCFRKFLVKIRIFIKLEKEMA